MGGPQGPPWLTVQKKPMSNRVKTSDTLGGSSNSGAIFLGIQLENDNNLKILKENSSQYAFFGV